MAIASVYIKSTFLKKIVEIALIPLGLFLIIGTIILPFGILFIHLFLYIFFSYAFPELIYQISKWFNIELLKNQSSISYLKLTSTVFIAVLLNYQLRKFIYIISPARIKSSHKLKPYELDKLTDYMLSENNVRFLIYSFYVVLLLIINVQNFENHSFSSTLLKDKAILQSFVTFIALDRALNLLKQLEFKPSDFLHKILKSIGNKLDDSKQQIDKKKDILE